MRSVANHPLPSFTTHLVQIGYIHAKYIYKIIHNLSFPSIVQSINEAVAQLKLVKGKMDSLTSAQTQLGSWDGWVTKIFSKKEKETNNSKDPDPTTTDSTDTSPQAKNDAEILSETKKQYSKILDKVTELQRKNRKYELAKIMFESRLLRKRTEQVNRERYLKEQENYSNTDPEELLRKHVFPSVPK